MLSPSQVFVGSFLRLIQLGGLGIISFPSLIIVILGRRGCKRH
jgi:hypothetical protein